MSFTYVLHARPLRICIRTPSSAPIDRSPGGFWDSAKSKCRKHAIFGPLLEVKMLKKCTPLWREAHFQVKMHKTPQCRTIFGSCDVEKVHIVVARSTFGSQNAKNTRGSDHI